MCTADRIRHAHTLQSASRKNAKPSPTAAIINSQTSKRALSLDPSCYDVGKKFKGRKRHILVDITGHPVERRQFIGMTYRIVDGAFRLLRRARRARPVIERNFAEGGYTGQTMSYSSSECYRSLEIAYREAIRTRPDSSPCLNAGSSKGRSPGSSAIVAMVRDCERNVTAVTACVRVAMIRIMHKRLAAGPILEPAPSSESTEFRCFDGAGGGHGGDGEVRSTIKELC